MSLTTYVALMEAVLLAIVLGFALYLHLTDTTTGGR